MGIPKTSFLHSMKRIKYQEKWFNDRGKTIHKIFSSAHNDKSYTKSLRLTDNM